MLSYRDGIPLLQYVGDSTFFTEGSAEEARNLSILLGFFKSVHFWIFQGFKLSAPITIPRFWLEKGRGYTIFRGFGHSNRTISYEVLSSFSMK